MHCGVDHSLSFSCNCLISPQDVNVPRTLCFCSWKILGECGSGGLGEAPLVGWDFIGRFRVPLRGMGAGVVGVRLGYQDPTGLACAEQWEGGG